METKETKKTEKKGEVFSAPPERIFRRELDGTYYRLHTHVDDIGKIATNCYVRINEDELTPAMIKRAETVPM